MNRIVREHYPVERLPEDLRAELGAVSSVRISIEAEVQPSRNIEAILKDIQERKARGDWPLATDDPVERIRKLRDEWDD